MKKILFVSPTGTLDNGAEIAAINLMEYLVEQQYHIYNIFPKSSNNGNYKERLKASSISYLELGTWHWWWEEFGSTDVESHKTNVIYYLDNIYRIRQFIKNNDIDVVITNTVNVFQGLVAAAMEGIPHYYLIHEYPDREFSYYLEKLPFIFENSTKVFTASKELANLLADVTKQPDKISTFIPYTDVTVSQVKQGTEKRLVSIGRINERKNQLELLKAYKELDNKLPLIFIGGWDASYKEKCDQFISENDLDDVQFLGETDNPWNYVKSEDICILPSNMETFSLVFVEAVLHGIPLIYSDIVGHQSPADYLKAGISYSLGDVNQLSETITRTLRDFSSEKERANHNSLYANEKYNLKNAYTNLLDSLDETSDEASSLLAISNLIGDASIPSTVLPIIDEHITVFLGDNQGEFHYENTLSFPFKYPNGNIEFQVDESVSCIRIDVTERKSYYDSIVLTDLETGDNIPPSSWNGLKLGDSYFFSEEDPQIVFNLPDYTSQKFKLSYSTANMDNYERENFLPDRLIDQVFHLQEKQEQIIANYEEQINTLQHQYDAVINSRRWKIPTKIINFFRRK